MKKTKIGFDEYTFELYGPYPGIIVVKIEAGLVKHGREYQYQTKLNWEEFTSHKSF